MPNFLAGKMCRAGGKQSCVEVILLSAILQHLKTMSRLACCSLCLEHFYALFSHLLCRTSLRFYSPTALVSLEVVD